MIDLKDLTYEELSDFVVSLGEPKFKACGKWVDGL